MIRSTPVLLLLASLLLPLGACVSQPSNAPSIPPSPDERVPRPPASSVNLIWQPGHYDWDGAAYHWISGEWVPSAGHGRLWQDGMWKPLGTTWVWEPAHWL